MIDEEDLELVHALQEAPRASWAAHAAVLGTEARVLSRRYARLVESGALRVMATTGPRLLQRLQFAHVRIRAEPGRADAVAEGLARWPCAATVRVTDGSFDVYALVVGAGHRMLLPSVHAAVAAVPGVVRVEVGTVLETVDVGRAVRLHSLSPQQRARLRESRRLPRPNTVASRLSEDDLAILAVLLEDGRTEVAELGRILQRESSTLSRRLARLQADGWLDFIAVLTDEASSQQVCALLWCTADPEDLPALIEKAPGLDWVGTFTVCTGRSNVFVTAHLQTPADVMTAQTELRRLAASLRFVETQVSSHAVKLHMRWLDEHGRWTDEVQNPFAEAGGDLVRAAGS